MVRSSRCLFIMSCFISLAPLAVLAPLSAYAQSNASTPTAIVATVATVPVVAIVATSPSPTATTSPVLSKDAQALKAECQKHFPGLIQGELRRACLSPSDDDKELGLGLSQVNCRLNYGEEPRLVMACLIGVLVEGDLQKGTDSASKKLQLCSDIYPQHTEIDAFLQESCLTGVHIPELMNTSGLQRYEACSQLSPERSFVGPCAVGLSLAQDMLNPEAPTAQNKLCEQYFDHKRFHLTYRACLVARSIPVTAGPNRVVDVIQNCSNVVTDPTNDNERAACIIGSNIYRSLTRKDEVAKRFQKCGEIKVSYQERDTLACLTAASLLDMSDRTSAENGCKDVFKAAKNTSRGNCISSLGLF
jgi:hypothetical protein